MVVGDYVHVEDKDLGLSVTTHVIEENITYKNHGIQY